MADSQPVRISSDTQLFVDDVLIDTSEGLKRTLHQPNKDNGGNEPVLAITDEFAGITATLQANGTIVYDPKLKKWVMICIGASLSQQGANRVRLYRFTSDDAMTWTRGDDGTPQHIKFDMTDPASGQSASNTDLFSFCYDKNDAEFPYKGWLWFANWGDDRKKACTYIRSHDGRQWDRGRQIIRYNSAPFSRTAGRFGPSDVTTFIKTRSREVSALIKFANVAAVEMASAVRLSRIPS
jgi:hypothetical protein